MLDQPQHVSITCRDLEHSVRFYEKLGLKVIKHIAEVKTDGIAQALQVPTGCVSCVSTGLDLRQDANDRTLKALVFMRTSGTKQYSRQRCDHGLPSTILL